MRENEKTQPREKSARARREGAETPETGERIAKRLARAGLASRREAEEMIAAGRVAVNGTRLTTPAVKVSESDRIEVDGAPIPAIERTRLFLFHKPAGVVTTNRDPQGRRTVFDILPEDLPRLLTVGRLDINTEGLLLLTNDGGLARVLELPATGWLRRYRVRVHGKVDPRALEELEQGMAVGGVFYGAVEATLDRRQGSNAWLTIGLREGKNREVKNILSALGLEVTRLIRISYGPFHLGDLPEGAVREIKGRTLRDQLGPRLIAEAGANFDAPVTRPFANAPVQGGREATGRGKDKDRTGQENRAGQGVKSRPAGKPRPRDAREEALERLQTKPGGKPPRQDEERRRHEARPRSRAANVWRAKDARPVAPGKKSGEGAASGDKGRQRRPHAKPKTSEREAGRGRGKR